jgi:HAD superfamily hydrolase (TIGR01662 family)
MKKIKGIIFDMGSTLIEFENSGWVVLGERSAHRSYNFLKDKGLINLEFELYCSILRNLLVSAFEISEQNLEEFRFEDLALNLFKKLHLEIEDGDYTGFLDTYYKPVTEQVTLIQDAAETLRYFKGEGYKLGLVSNTIFPGRFHLIELKRFKLFPYLDTILFSSEVGYKKPHPQIFLQCLKSLRIGPEESIFIGDKLIEDIGGAKNVGMTGILKYKEGRDYSASIVPDEIIHNLSELPPLVRKMSEE